MATTADTATRRREKKETGDDGQSVAVCLRGATTLIVMGYLEVQMLDLIQIHSDHIAMTIVAAIPIVLLILRPKVSCCRRRRWEQPFDSPPPVKRHHESAGR
jgi:hypothetical protein